MLRDLGKSHSLYIKYNLQQLLISNSVLGVIAHVTGHNLQCYPLYPLSGSKVIVHLS